MQISDLQASNSFGASDVIAVDINGVTYKVTGSTLAAAILAGNAATATKATKDADGNTISSTYLKCSAGLDSTLTNNLYMNIAANWSGSLRYGTKAGTGTDYTTITQSDWGVLYYAVPAKVNADNTYQTARFQFRQYSPTPTGTRTSYYDEYRLPAATLDKTSNNFYNILTTKSAVTVAQGGTGQTGITYLNTASNIIDTVNTGFAVTTAEFVQWGKVASLRLVFTKTAAVTTRQTVVPCVIKSALRPKIMSSATSSYDTISNAWLSVSGNVNMFGTWEANGAKSFVATYILP